MLVNSQSLEDVLYLSKNEPRDVIMRKLIENGNVETLTQVKFNLAEQCHSNEDFPKSDLYIRCKPKEKSVYQTLEERLAADIFVLYTFTDTGVVSHDLRNLFKDDCISSQSSDLGKSRRNTSLENVRCNADKITSSQTPLNRTTGWSGVRDQIASIQSGYLLFREKISRDMAELEKKIQHLNIIVENQGNEIASLKEENQHLQQICINYPSSSGENPSGTIEKSTHVSCETSIMHYNNNESRGQQMPSENQQCPSGLEKHSHCQVNESDQRTDRALYSEKAKQPKEPSPSERPSGQQGLQPQLQQQQKVDNSDEPACQHNLASDLTSGECVISADNTNLGKNSDNQVPTEEEATCAQSVDDGFVGVQRKRNNIKRFFISGIDEKADAETVSRYLSKRGVCVTLLKLFSSKRKGTVSAKLHVKQEHAKIISSKEFWPQFVSCRPWLSKTKVESRVKELRTRQSQGAESHGANHARGQSTLV